MSGIHPYPTALGLLAPVSWAKFSTLFDASSKGSTANTLLLADLAASFVRELSTLPASPITLPSRRETYYVPVPALDPATIAEALETTLWITDDGTPFFWPKLAYDYLCTFMFSALEADVCAVSESLQSNNSAKDDRWRDDSQASIFEVLASANSSDGLSVMTRSVEHADAHK